MIHNRFYVNNQFFVVVVVIVVVVVLLSLVLEKCHVDNRLTCVIGMLLAIMGATILADWQSIKGDPCNQLDNKVTVFGLNSSSWLQDCSSPRNITVQLSATVMIDTINQATCLHLKRAKGTHSITMQLVSSCEDVCHDQPSICELVWRASQHCTLDPSSFVCFPLVSSGGTLDHHLPMTLQCLWPQRSLYIRLQVDHETGISLIQDVEDLGSGGGVYNDAMSKFACNFEHSSHGFGDGCMFVILNISCESESSETCVNEWCGVTSDCHSRNCTDTPEDIHCLAEEDNVDLTSCLSPSRNTTNQSICVCQAFSSVAGYNCFWNQVSRITGEFCERCPPTCLSEAYSLNFVQLIIGLLLFAPAYPFGRLTPVFILSDYLGGKSQV